MTAQGAVLPEQESEQEPGAARRSRAWLPWAQYAALLLAAVVWGRVVTGRAGGSDPGALVIGPLSLLPAVLLAPPPLRHLRPLGVLVLAALAVCAFSPYGFSGAQTVAVAAYSAVAFAVVAGFATSTARRHAVAGVLCLVSLDQFAQGFLAWWGGEDPSKRMIGTFYWHNQYAAFLLSGVLVGASLAVFSRSHHRIIGLVSAPICLAGIVYSTSRATMMVAALGLAVVALAALLAPDRRRLLPVVGALAVAGVAALFFFTSPVFFADSASPFAATEVRGSQESLGQNTGYRLDFWRAAVGELVDRPVVGGGFGSFGELSGSHLPVAAVRSSSAHNELLQALAEGGLVWGLPVLGSVLALVLAALVRLRDQLRLATEDRAVVIGAGTAVLAMILHAAVDFDWSYPSLVVSLAAAGGLVVAVPRPGRPQQRAQRAPAVVGGLLAAAALLLGAQLAWAQDRTTEALKESNAVLVREGPEAAARALLDTQSWFADPRIDARLIELGLAYGPGRPLTLPAGLLSTAVANSADYASVVDDVNARRAAVLLGLGRQQEALEATRRMARERGHARPTSLQAYARLLSLAGKRQQAVELIGGTIVLRADEARGNVLLGRQLLALQAELDALAPGGLEARCAGSALTAAGVAVPEGSAPLPKTRSGDACAPLEAKGWA